MADAIILSAPPQRPDVLIIAGEHSGDEHAAALVQGTLAERPDWKVCALGGDALRAAGAQVLFDLVDHSVVGFAEVVRHYGFFKALFAAVAAWIAEHRPRAVCFVDYPGFNLRLAKQLYADGLAAKAGGDIRLLYYIGPQIWAWKSHRRFAMAETLDALSVIFPFEAACYADTTLPVEFVGHPFVADGFDLGLRHDLAGPVLLLPGSRVKPVRRIFPVLADAFLASGQTARGAVALYPSEAVRAELASLLTTRPGAAAHIKLRPASEPLAASLALTSSGTMSLKVALAGIPGRVVYRANPLTYWMARALVKIPYLGIANLLLERAAYPEFIQGAARPTVLAREIDALAADPVAATRSHDDARALRGILGEGAGQRAAAWLQEHADPDPAG